MNKKMMLVIFTALTLTACAGDPRNEADAYETRTLADQAALDAEQARSHQAALNAVELAEAERAAQIREANKVQSAETMGWILRYGGMALMVSAVMVSLAAGAGLSAALIEGGRAAGRAAMVKANLIPLDRASGQYPALIQYMGNGRYSLTDANTHTTLELDTRNEPDRAMVAGAMAVRHALVLSAAAARSKNPEGVAMIEPMVLEVTE